MNIDLSKDSCAAQRFLNILRQFIPSIPCVDYFLTDLMKETYKMT